MYGENDYMNNEYTYMSHESRMKLFNAESWDKMSNDAKLSLLQAEAVYYAKEKGIENVPEFKFEDNPRLCGGYSPSYGHSVISVNLLTCLNPYQALNTMAHEMNHAYQDQCIRQHSGLDEGELAVMRAQWGCAYENSGRPYSRQTLENDSNNAGALYVMQQREYFCDDPAYLAYCASVMDEMQDLAIDYAQNRAESDISEKSQVERSYTAGEISLYERETAERYIDGVNAVKVNMLEVAQKTQEEFEAVRTLYFQNKANESYSEMQGIDSYNAVNECINEAKSNYEAECKAIKGLDKNNPYETIKHADYELSTLLIESQVSAGRLKDMGALIEAECARREESIIDYARENGLTSESVRANPELEKMLCDYNAVLTEKGECDKYINLIEQNAHESAMRGYPDYSNCDMRPQVEVLNNEQLSESTDNAVKQYYRDNPEALTAAIEEAISQHKVYECLEEMHSSPKGFFESRRQKECLKEMVELQKTNAIKVNDLQEAEKSLKEVRNGKMQEYGAYVSAHSMQMYEAKSDPYLKQLAAEMVELDNKISSTRYHIAELQTDNELMGRETGPIELPDKKIETEQHSEVSEKVDTAEAVNKPLEATNSEDEKHDATVKKEQSDKISYSKEDIKTNHAKEVDVKDISQNTEAKKSEEIKDFKPEQEKPKEVINKVRDKAIDRLDISKNQTHSEKESKKDIEAPVLPDKKVNTQNSVKTTEVLKLPEERKQTQSSTAQKDARLELPKATVKTEKSHEHAPATLKMPERNSEVAKLSKGAATHEKMALPNPNLNTHQSNSVSTGNNMTHSSADRGQSREQSMEISMSPTR